MRATLVVFGFIVITACTGPVGPMGAPGDPGQPGSGDDTGVAAGGALAGTYPNPTIAPGAVGPDQIGTIPTVQVTIGPDTPIANATVTKLTLSGASYDTAGMFSATQPTRITAPIDGIYLITAGIKWRASGGGTQRFATIRDKNGEDIGITQVAPVNSALAFTSEIVSVQTKLAKNDFIELFVLQDSGATLNLVNGLSMQMTWIAPSP